MSYEGDEDRPLGVFSGPAEKRPKGETALLVWMRATNTSQQALAKVLGVEPRMVGLWMYGQVVPGLVYAFKIEATTKGGVGVESWLGTELARAQWEFRKCTGEEWEFRIGDRDRKRKREWAKKNYGKNTKSREAVSPGTSEE